MSSVEVSTSTASSAGRSGDAVREESSRSRRARSACVSGAPARPAAVFSASRRPARTSSEAVRKTFRPASGRHDGADVAALDDDPAAVLDDLGDDPPLLVHQVLRGRP